MDFTNEFRVNLPPDGAWALLTDVERIAPCMPGAQLTGVDGDAYNGVVKVKVGPMTVQYKGVVSFEEKDETGRTAVLHARGRDTRGQGNADARVTARLVPDGDGTRVTVDTRLTITGRVAQFGKGMIEEISGRLLTQFVDNLEGRLATERRRARTTPGTDEPLPQAHSQAPVSAPAPAPAADPEPGPTPTAKAATGSGTGPDTGPSPGAEVAASAAAAPGTGLGHGSGSGPDTGVGHSVGTGTGLGPGAEVAASAAAAPGATAADGPTTGAGQGPAPVSPAASAGPVSDGGRAAPAPPAPAAVQPLDLMSVARGAILKRALPAVLVLAVIVIVLVVWLTS
ncbi:SRPBCC family protein [Streptomyces sp. LRE541]|uniref:SRPBCC family protein n=1 Tax=Streptomyces sp. LRE541 TaxID=2931983 RepID=UPI00200C76DB|nr:SRPBCC family protein [Streptomyces sp. LRE541]UPZ33319.1 SRPBCC family protein [Streptomyces sp. LRE541]